MELDVLSGGDVAQPPRRESVGDVSEGVHLVGREAAVRDLDPHHVLPGLSLAGDAVLKPKGAEGIAQALAGQKGLRLPLKPVDLHLYLTSQWSGRNSGHYFRSHWAPPLVLSAGPRLALVGGDIYDLVDQLYRDNNGRRSI